MATGHATAQERFIKLLREDILQVESAELDFGIYRVLNHRRADLERFLTQELPARISAALAALPNAATEDEQARIYNALYTLFARYYDSGDFLPRPRRGKAGRYVVPYDGSDTHFHWATKGSHYVKSGERFAGYAYQQPGGLRVRLLVQAASVERDNTKGAQRHYVPVALLPPGPAHPGEWRLAFEHRVLTDDELARAGGKKKRRGAAAEEPAMDAQEAEEAEAGEPADPAPVDAAEGASVQDRVLNAWLAANPPPAAVDTALLARHAQRYVKGQTTDFFVHPQLGRFLREELDIYLQTEFVNLWDLPDTALARERGKLAICRQLGRALIDVLASLEDLQAALFEKRKFVLEASYLVMCSWLRARGAEGAALVDRAAQHPPQVARWRQWLGEAAGSQASGPELLAHCPHLPMDTALFDEDFRWAVLAAVPDLQAALGGVLVHGDNYAALRTLEGQWRAGVKCIYIDPPYNTGKDGFLYKDDFTRHSAWASQLAGRLSAARALMSDDSVQFASIDHNERATLSQLIGEAFEPSNIVGEIVWKNVTDNNPTNIANEHEFIHCVARDSSLLAPEWKSKNSEVKRLLLRKGHDLISEFSNDEALKSAYASWYRDNRDELGSMDGYKFIDRKGIYAGSRSVHNPGKQGYRYDVIHPVTGNPCRQPLMGYRFPQSTMNELIAQGKVIFGADENKLVELKAYAEDYEDKLSSLLVLDGRAGANDLRALLPDELRFTTPKPCSLLSRLLSFVTAENDFVLDYFAGSGTTAHAVINLNRDDGGQRKFILVEQGEYFDTVTLPRVAKVMACPEWKDGQPRAGVQHDAAATGEPESHWSARTLPVVQVLRIERYEDSLDALALPEAAGAASQAELAGFDALLRYVADAQDAANPVRLSTAALARPLDYRLPTVWEGRAVERPVDLLHTALLLLGLHPVRLRRLPRPAAAGGGFALLAEVRPHRPGQPASAVPLELLLLREHDLDALKPAAQAQQMQAERDWLLTAVHVEFGRTLAGYAAVHHNRDLLLSGEGERGLSLDAALAQAMWARDPAFSAAAA